MAPLLRFLLLVLLGSVLATAAAAPGAATTPRTPDQVALSWGGEVFSDPSQLATWLAARGASYGVWAERHPAAAELLEWAAAERARRGVPQGAPFTGVPERVPGASVAPPPLAVPDERPGFSLWLALAITAGLLALAVGANAVVRRIGRPGLDPVTLAVSGAGLTAGVVFVVFVASARF